MCTQKVALERRERERERERCSLSLILPSPDLLSCEPDGRRRRAENAISIGNPSPRSKEPAAEGEDGCTEGEGIRKGEERPPPS